MNPMTEQKTIPALRPARPPMQPASGVRRIKLDPHQMTDRMTQADDLFVLAHLGIPRVDPAGWSLTVDGLVGRTINLSLDALKARPKKVVDTVHQCCGSPLEPTVPTRRVANVRWGGADLAALLDEAGVDPKARFLWSYGLDGGDFGKQSCDWYVKDLPLERLDAGGVLLAYELNDAPLPAVNGFPVRLLVPGYYGTNSVKWLWRLHLAERRADSLFTTDLYNDPVGEEDRTAGLPSRRPVWAIAPESVIVAPAPDTIVETGKRTEICGWAWSFRGIAAAEISLDGGITFVGASVEPRRGWAWQRFSLPWWPTVPGEMELCVRALEAGGTTQPAEGARNAIHRVRVTVR